MFNKLRNRVYAKKIKKEINKKYIKNFFENAFENEKLDSFWQYEAAIIKMYHAIEKGMSYENYRPGFGEDAIKQLITTMEKYAEKFSIEEFCYKTALCVLKKYIAKNKEYNYTNAEIENRVNALKGEANGAGGIIEFVPFTQEQLTAQSFEEFIKNRHSIRHFSEIPVDKSKIAKAVELAQFTPSACNRQGWRTHIVCNKKKIEAILKNQNGNRGFGQEIDKLLVISFKIDCFSKGREHYQGFIDGGMYAMNLIYSLHFFNIGSVPLSASLTPTQEENVKKVLNINDNEKIILFVGIGNYPEKCQTTKSERKEAEIIFVD